MDKHDNEAILNAYNLVRRRTAKVANKKSADADLVEDAVHDGIISILKSQERTKVRNLAAYWFKTAYRELVRSAAVRKRDKAVHIPLDLIEEDLPTSTATTQVDANLLADDLRECLPLDELELVKWHKADGLSFDEIAKLKNISPEAARKRYERALTTIRRLLGV